jgi:hypothetical protein
MAPDSGRLVTCDLRGGFGNQLFQVAATLAYAWDHGLVAVFSDADVVTPAAGPIPCRRSYFSEGLLAGLRGMTCATTSLPGWPDAWEHVSLEQHHHVEIPGPAKGREETVRVCLKGYFQSHRYFARHEAALFQLFQRDARLQALRAQLWPPRAEAAAHHLPRRRSVSVHFRQGDYKHLQHFHNVLPPAYYAAALDHVLGSDDFSAAPVDVYYACEDEDAALVEEAYVPALARALAGRGRGGACHRLLPEAPDHEQLLGMACCDAHVIANSSFSWWAAYLGDSPVKIVCYPSRWFGPGGAGHCLRDMFPEGWRCIQTP